MRSLLAVVALCLATPAVAQDAPLFASDAPLDVVLTFDVDEVADDRSDKPPWYPATLAYAAPGGEAGALDVGVRARGFFRLHRAGCRLPPLRLKVGEGGAGGTVFEGQGKLKLVTHCRDRDDDEQRVLQEHLLYRAYGLLTDVSFRTRLARVTYRDATGRRDDVTRFGFLIEDDEHVAARLGGQIVEGPRIHPEATDRDQMTLMSVFHYMVGNTDWGVSRLHNVRLVHRQAVADSLARVGALGGSASALVAVPYDFDWAGLVDAPYATPDPQLGIRTVRDRKFLGFCREPHEIRAVLVRLRARERDLYALFHESPHLDPDVAEESVAYLRSFFEQVATERGVDRAFGDCQGS